MHVIFQDISNESLRLHDDGVEISRCPCPDPCLTRSPGLSGEAVVRLGKSAQARCGITWKKCVGTHATRGPHGQADTSYATWSVMRVPTRHRGARQGGSREPGPSGRRRGSLARGSWGHEHRYRM